MLKFSLPNFTMYSATYNTTLIFDMHVDMLILFMIIVIIIIIIINYYAAHIVILEI